MNNLNLSRPLTIIDLETTGLSTTDDRIIEISAVKIYNDGTRSKFYTLINPQKTIDPQASEVHGYTNEMLREYPTFKEVAPSLLNFITDCYISGFNVIRFDIPFLMSEFDRVGIKWDLPFTDIIDVMNIYHKHEPRNLSAAYKFYTGNEREGAHQAQNDVFACIDILEAQVDKYSLSNEIDVLIEEYSPMKGYLDFAKKLKYNDNGQVCFAFGKYNGISLEDVCRKNKRYFSWVFASDIHQNTKDLIKIELMKLNLLFFNLNKDNN